MATFGRTDGVDTSDQNLNGWIAGRFDAPADGDGTIDTFHAYLKNWGNAVKMALYKKSDNSLVGVSEEKNLPVGGARDWVSFNAVGAINVTNGVDYYIVVWAGGACYVGYDATGANLGAEGSQAYNGFPDPWNPSVKDRNICVYCTYTPAAAPSVGGVSPSGGMALFAVGLVAALSNAAAKQRKVRRRRRKRRKRGATELVVDVLMYDTLKGFA